MGEVTRTLRTPAIVLTVLAAAMAGCEPQGISGPSGELGPPRREDLTVSDLAPRLGMNLAHASYSTATLRDEANTVVLYADPDGAVYVNAVEIPDSRGIASQDGTLLVPASLVPRIRAMLRPAGPAPAYVEPTIVRPRVPPTPRRRTSIGTVVIDPGHGGKDPGCKSVFGTREKHIVLPVSRQLAEQLRSRGVDVVMTRDDDRFLELEDRPAVAGRARADLFVSIHADWAKNRSARGYTAYVSRSASKRSVAAAGAILRGMRSTGAANRGIRRADFRVLVHSPCPAVLVELGFLSNRAEAARLEAASHQHRYAEAVARGIVDYLKRR